VLAEKTRIRSGRSEPFGWDATGLSKNWEIYAEAGEDAGCKYPCGSARSTSRPATRTGMTGWSWPGRWTKSCTTTVSNLPNVAVDSHAVEFRLGPPVKGNQKLPFKLKTPGDLATAS
jgi:hypothetical protein